MRLHFSPFPSPSLLLHLRSNVIGRKEEGGTARDVRLEFFERHLRLAFTLVVFSLIGVSSALRELGEESHAVDRASSSARFPLSNAPRQVDVLDEDDEFEEFPTESTFPLRSGRVEGFESCGIWVHRHF